MTQSNLGSVVNLFKQGPHMKNQIILDLLSYWETLRGGRLVPARSDIDPRAIKNCLPHTFVLEKSRAGISRFRLAGMQVCNLLGMELRSMPALSLINPDDRDKFVKVLNAVMDNPQIVELHLSGEAYGNKRIKAQMLLMPMVDREHDVSRILGCIILETPLTRAPIRFDIDDIKTTRVVADKSTTMDLDMHGLAEEPAAFKHAAKLHAVDGDGDVAKTPTKGGRSHLKIVK